MIEINLKDVDSFEKFIGNKRLVNTLKVVLNSSKKRNVALDHVLLHGPHGLGKSTLARIVAKEQNSNFRYVRGSSLNNKSDLLALFGSLSKGDVLFVQSIENVNSCLDDFLVTALEDGVIDIVIGVEGDSKIVRMKLPPFTLIGTTAKIDRISPSLKDRFGIIGKLRKYDDNEIKEMLEASSKRNGFLMSGIASDLLSSCSRGNPGIANNILLKVYQCSLDSHCNLINRRVSERALSSLGIYKEGLYKEQVEYLKLLSKDFNGGTVSIDSISGCINRSKESIAKVIEPLLIEKKLICKSSVGRKITPAGIDYLSGYNFQTIRNEKERERVRYE